MKIKKAAAVFLSVIMAILFVGCGKGGNDLDNKKESQDTFPYWETVHNRETAKQYYRQEGVEFPASLWQTPTAERYEALDRNDVKAYFVSSLGDEKVFCYVGLPKSAHKDGPVPAVVCVHGATGTAFYDWVEMWNERGYAAIAMDTEGRMAKSDTSMSHPVMQESIKPHGPFNASFQDSDRPISEQWVYHALAAVISCTGFIASFDEVDETRIGITGVSYGGFLACLVAGYDDRYVFAAPVYGCLANSGSDAEFGTYIDGNAGAEIWDGLGPLAASNSVFLFVNGNTDRHFPLDSTAKSVNACKQAALCVKDRYTHGHSEGATVDEVFVFADEICKKGTPLVHITACKPENGELAFATANGVTVTTVRQYYTLSDVLNDTTSWSETTVEWEAGYAFYSTEQSKMHYYIEIEDSRGCVVAGPVQSRK